MRETERKLSDALSDLAYLYSFLVFHSVGSSSGKRVEVPKKCHVIPPYCSRIYHSFVRGGWLWSYLFRSSLSWPGYHPLVSEEESFDGGDDERGAIHTLYWFKWKLLGAFKSAYEVWRLKLSDTLLLKTSSLLHYACVFLNLPSPFRFFAFWRKLFCRIVNNKDRPRKGRNECGVTHAQSFVRCAIGIVYRILLPCKSVYVGQTGRMFKRAFERACVHDNEFSER